MKRSLHRQIAGVSLFLWIAFFQVGCSNIVRKVDWTSLSDAQSVGSGLFFSLELLGQPDRADLNRCVLSLRERNQGLVYEWPVSKTRAGAKSTELEYLIPLPPGVYLGLKLKCDPFYSWEVDALFSGGVEIKPERLSFAGQIIFDFGSKKDTLVIRYADRTETLKGLGSLFPRVHSKRRGDWISAYTGRTIEPGMVQGEFSGQLKISKVRKESAPETDITVLAQNLTACTQDDSFLDDHARVGHLKWVGECTKASAPFHFVEEVRQSAMSENFENCLKSALEKFDCPQPVQITVQF